MSLDGPDPTESSSLSFELLEGNAYASSLESLLPRAKKRIVLAAMIVISGKQTDKIFALLRAALKRNVRVHVLLDKYTFTPYPHGDMPASERRRRNHETHSMLAELERQGATVTQVGKIRLNPFKGRCHVKITVIDDDCFSFGGVNFTDESFAVADYMLHTRNASLADHLEKLTWQIGTQQPPLPDQEIMLNSQSSILFDGGQTKQSIIYEHACQLAEQAKHVHFVSQMVPSGKLGELIRRKPNTLYYNQPLQFTAPGSWAQAFDEQKYRLQNRYTNSRFIHAKFIVFDMPNGRRAAITGSNNFSYRGVAFGTQEIALQTSDPAICKQLLKFMRKLH